ncbi:MAG: hypothetical protein ACSLE8_05790 [Rhodococcus sp. (in: high G+C Gram-positive bacteria)]
MRVPRVGGQAFSEAARHADPRITTTDKQRRQNFDRLAAYIVVAFSPLLL